MISGAAEASSAVHDATIFNCRSVDNTGFGIALYNGSAYDFRQLHHCGYASSGIELKGAGDVMTIARSPATVSSVGGSPIVTNSSLWDNSFDGITPPYMAARL